MTRQTLVKRTVVLDTGSHVKLPFTEINLRALRHWLDKEDDGNYEILKYNGKKKKRNRIFVNGIRKSWLGRKMI